MKKWGNFGQGKNGKAGGGGGGGGDKGGLTAVKEEKQRKQIEIKKKKKQVRRVDFSFYISYIGIFKTEKEKVEYITRHFTKPVIGLVRYALVLILPATGKLILLNLNY